MNACAAWLFLVFVVLSETSIPEPYDKRCKIVPNTNILSSSRKCHRQRWFFDWRAKKCIPTCNEAAPFSSKIECQATCRSGDVCDFPVASAVCYLEAFPVYIYNPQDRTCFLTYDCTHFLNKFPTLWECHNTCRKRRKEPANLPTNFLPSPVLRQPSTVKAGTLSQSKINTGIEPLPPQLPAGRYPFPITATSADLDTFSNQPDSSSQTASSQLTMTNDVELPAPLVPNDAAREVVAGTTVSSVVGRRLPSYFDILPSKQGAATSNIPILKIKTSPRPPTKDIRCRMRALSIPRKTCHYKRWYYNEKAQVCVSTCSNDAPFLSKIFCDGLCRTAEVCKFPMASFPCFHEVHPVFIYNPNEKSCFKSYSCSFFGNKFPTLDECRLACKKCAAKQQVGCLGKSLKSKDKDRNFSSSDRNRTSQLISHSSTGAVH